MSKYRTTIKLVEKDEEGKHKQAQFESVEFLPGAIVEDVAGVMEEIQTTTDKQPVRKVLSRVYSPITDTLFEGQFTNEDYCKGIDAHETASLTGKLLESVTADSDEAYTETGKK